MTAPERRVFNAIPIGRRFAISNKALADAVGLNPRLVQSLVQALRRRRIIVCSATEPPYGYYLPASRDESEACIGALRHRLSEESKTVRAMEVGHAKRYGAQQLAMEEFV